MDQSSMSRAAFLCAYVEEVRQGVADAFFVRYTKFQTVDEREAHPETSQKGKGGLSTDFT